MDLKSQLAKNLKFLRKVSFLSQEQLAEKANVNIGVIKYAELGKTWPEAQNLAALADALGAKPWEMLTDLEKRMDSVEESAELITEYEDKFSEIIQRLDRIDQHLSPENSHRRALFQKVLNIIDVLPEAQVSVLEDVLESRFGRYLKKSV